MNKSLLDKLTINKKELVYFHGLIFISTTIRTEIVAIHHDKPIKRYLGIKKTTELITKNYYILNLRQKVRDYIRQYKTYIRNKSARHQPYGQMQTQEAL